MRTLKIALPIIGLLALGGCVAVPAAPDYYGYGYGPGYYTPAPAYYAPPVYYGPSFGISVFSGRRGGHRFRGHR